MLLSSHTYKVYVVELVLRAILDLIAYVPVDFPEKVPCANIVLPFTNAYLNPASFFKFVPILLIFIDIVP